MWRSEFPRNALSACALAAACCAATPAHALDGAIRINESTLNKLAAAAEPMKVTGSFNFKVGGISICSSAFTVRIKDAKFRIRPSGLALAASVTAEWCSLSFSGDLTTTGDVTYSASQSTIRMSVVSSTVQPKFTISAFGVSYTAKLPIHINVGDPFNPPPIPVTTALLSFQTADGPQNLRVEPQNLTLTKQDGVILLDADARVW